mmetsp:Transcript_10709/g.25542  ORF Transcript_10709/g.25542 Transcript_10709/m.25542 type:complete len:110 (+) Transcript_10709:1394-1723(+)
MLMAPALPLLSSEKARGRSHPTSTDSSPTSASTPSRPWPALPADFNQLRGDAAGSDQEEPGSDSEPQRLSVASIAVTVVTLRFNGAASSGSAAHAAVAALPGAVFVPEY